GGAQNIVRRDAALLAGELVAAARPARALEDAVAHQRLQHRLQMPRRQAVARRQRFGRDRPSARVKRDIDDGGDGQGAFALQERHEIPEDWRNGCQNWCPDSEVRIIVPQPRWRTSESEDTSDLWV